MLRALLATLVIALSPGSPALADYASGKAHFNAFSPEQQTAITLALIATGDFEGLAEHGYTRLLYKAVTPVRKSRGLPRRWHTGRGGDRPAHGARRALL